MPDVNNSLAKLLRGSQGGGQADDIPALIDGMEPAALSEGEYVIPADVVSMLGDGSTEAGARILDQLIKDIRKTKTGKTKQAGPIKEGFSKLLNNVIE